MKPWPQEKEVTVLFNVRARAVFSRAFSSQRVRFDGKKEENALKNRARNRRVLWLNSSLL